MKKQEYLSGILSYDDDKIEEIVSYNELCDLVAEQHEREESGEMELFAFREIGDHQGPLKSTDPRYKGSSYNVLVLWEDGSETWEPLGVMASHGPATLAAYGRKSGWGKYDLLFCCWIIASIKHRGD